MTKKQIISEVEQFGKLNKKLSQLLMENDKNYINKIRKSKWYKEVDKGIFVSEMSSGEEENIVPELLNYDTNNFYSNYTHIEKLIFVIDTTVRPFAIWEYEMYLDNSGNKIRNDHIIKGKLSDSGKQVVNKILGQNKYNTKIKFTPTIHDRSPKLVKDLTEKIVNITKKYYPEKLSSIQIQQLSNINIENSIKSFERNMLYFWKKTQEDLPDDLDDESVENLPMTDLNYLPWILSFYLETKNMKDIGDWITDNIGVSSKNYFQSGYDKWESENDSIFEKFGISPAHFSTTVYDNEGWEITINPTIETRYYYNQLLNEPPEEPSKKIINKGTYGTGSATYSKSNSKTQYSSPFAQSGERFSVDNKVTLGKLNVDNDIDYNIDFEGDLSGGFRYYDAIEPFNIRTTSKNSDNIPLNLNNYPTDNKKIRKK